MKFLVSVREAASLLSLSPRTIRTLVSQKALPTISVGRRKLIRTTDLQSLAESNGVSINARVAVQGVAIDGV